MLSVDQTSIRLDVDVRIEPDFDFLSAEYREFYRPDRATAFQAPLLMSMVHQRLVGALNAQQRTLTVRDRRNGALVMLVPFVLQRIKGIRMLTPADFGVCDYNSIVGDRNTLALIAADPMLVGRINRELDGCDILMFRKVREDDFDVTRIFPGSKASPAENATYHSRVGDDFDAWQRRTMRRKFSKELGRLQRQTERQYGSYAHRPAATDEEVRTAFEQLRGWRVRRFEGDLLQDPLYFDFYRDYALAGLASGEALTYVSYVGDEPGAVLFGPTGDGNFHAVLIGADTEHFGKQSPGLQLIYQVIKRRFAEGFRYIDLGPGNSGYKTHFRVEQTRLINYTKAVTLRGHAMALIYHHAKPLKNMLRSYAPHVH